MPGTPSDPTPAELLALQALLDSEHAHRDSSGRRLGRLPRPPDVRGRVRRVLAERPAGRDGDGGAGWPAAYRPSPRRARRDAAPTPHLRGHRPSADLATNPASPSPPGGLTARSRSSTAARARSQAACALRGRDRAAGRAVSSRSRFSSRASTRCARRSASRACPPRPGSDSATRPSSPTSATSSELGVALAPRPVATRYRCSSLALPPSRRPSSRFEPASVPGWRRIQVSRPRSSPDPRLRKVPESRAPPHARRSRGPSHASSARRSGSRRPACGQRGLA